jgi:hypothetical protein
LKSDEWKKDKVTVVKNKADREDTDEWKTAEPKRKNKN